ncbi:hypothetical protein YTPLAS21_19500 [Candidatus Nitrosocosmicus sp.]|nr:hypothetical protein YTPLAS21_19500 [Candidatus Nitrosocosmicus sp.]
MLTNEQLEERLNYVTGSDAAVICGFSPYKTKVQLWLEKTRRVEQDDISNKNIIKFGNFMEQGIADWFSSESGILLKAKALNEPESMQIHKTNKWMAGNIDYLALEENAGVECKSSGRPGEEWGNGENLIPNVYMFQCAHYAMVYDFDIIYLPVVFASTRELRWYTYERNKNLESIIEEREYNFWHKHVLADVPPDPDTEQEVKQLYKETKSSPIQATHEIIDSLYKMKDIDIQIKELEATKQLHKDKVARFMCQHDTLLNLTGEPVATWKNSKPVKQFNKDKLELEHPDIFAKYASFRNPVRTFRNNIGK